MPRRFFPGLVFVTLALGGCARTDDGTVVIPEPLDIRRVDLGPLDMRHPGRMRPVESRPNVVATVPEPFPVSPHAGTRTARKSARRLSSARPPAGEASSGLACRSVTRSGERVQVVCD
ncbi:hypothetical protein [Aquamicrobium soli]|jgi:hypothetical protein|uniref:Lipoprotein n=1 Tax=Aquamicrobium soli TaxID=1811518 RepID=A0ABV7KCQ8_9HYPH